MISFISFIWLSATAAIFFGFIIVLLDFKFIQNLFVFGKPRSLERYKLAMTGSFLQVPKRWFYHFYLIGLICHTMVLGIVGNVVLFSSHFPDGLLPVLKMLRYPVQEEIVLVSPVSVLIVLLLEEIQMLRRLLECVYVNSYSEGIMSIPIYLTGVMYYCVIGLSTVSLLDNKAITLGNLINGVRWYHVLSVAMFIFGSWKQHKLNNILASLRLTKSGKLNDTGHHIPRGDLFEYSSCPHFCMEILIYASLCTVFLWQHQVMNCIFAFVLVNQLIAGQMTHWWYQEKFPEYPKQRSAVIPFIHLDWSKTNTQTKKLN